ncbi:hypothetical protein SR882_10250 [Guyparkeria halophila]|uniref:Lipid/polyisoprenoid-binding YceI-like domain-containing protein n=1 Tax=Guyparkeria halophila TaxID=47960 RepID=A0ABZ0YVR5_9GAMM|nr:hypothetical protein [Guyparkeria halophila]WQH16131.1 hypothetical protein SR882_10250 [Guyparkeria halophila]
MAQHIITGSGAPSARPEHPGQHYVDESASPRVTYIGLDTDPEAPVAECWQEVGSGGGSSGGTLAWFTDLMLEPTNGGEYVHDGAGDGSQVVVDFFSLNLEAQDLPFTCRVKALNGNGGINYSGPWDSEFIALDDGLNMDTAGEINVNGDVTDCAGIDMEFGAVYSSLGGSTQPPGQIVLTAKARILKQPGGGAA